MKKLFVITAAVLTLFAAAAEHGVVNASVLNARRAPSLKSPVMWKIPSGHIVTVTGVCPNNWLEIEVGPEAPVYVSEAYVVGGKASASVKLHTGKGNSFPAWGELKKGDRVILTEDRGYGWVRIVPPESLRAYVYGMYVKKANVVFATTGEKCERHVTIVDGTCRPRSPRRNPLRPNPLPRSPKPNPPPPRRRSPKRSPLRRPLRQSPKLNPPRQNRKRSLLRRPPRRSLLRRPPRQSLKRSLLRRRLLRSLKRSPHRRPLLRRLRRSL